MPAEQNSEREADDILARLRQQAWERRTWTCRVCWRRISENADHGHGCMFREVRTYEY